MLIYIIATIFVLGILILIHELGHFIVAKAVDIRVPRFSMGLGPKLIGVKWGETEYCISAIPFGGYVKMAGESSGEFIEGGDKEEGEEEPEVSPRDFDQKPIWARLIVVSAGSATNYIWAFLIFIFLSYSLGVPYLPLTEIKELDWGEEEPIAELSELKVGDRILSVNNTDIKYWSKMYNNLIDESKPLSITWVDVEDNVHEAQFPSIDTETRERLVEVLRPAIPARVGQIQKDSPAEEAGFQRGDIIKSVHGVRVTSWVGAVKLIKMNPEVELSVKVKRGDSIVNLSVTPLRKMLPKDNETFQEVGQIGILSDLPMRDLTLLESIRQGTKETYFISAFILTTVKQLITGEISPRMLGGPVMIGEMAGSRARWGFSHLLRFMALFSINLAILNILPIPVLDGGHVLFLLIEKMRGRPVPEKLRIRLSQVGMILLILLMVYVTANDGLRLLNLY
jgi:regulator of sigma E protease